MSIRSVIAREGYVKAIPYGICRLAQRCFVLDLTYVMIQDAANTSVPDCDLDVVCRFLTADEVRHFAEDPINDLDADLADRIELGYDHCFAGLLHGRLVGYCWLARHSVEAEHNLAAGSTSAGIAFSYPDEYAFRYKGYTHPEFRGRRVYQRVGSAACLAMQPFGVRYLISTTEIVNYSAIRSARRSGYQTVGWTCLFGIGECWTFWGGPNLSDRGIRIGQHANVLCRNALPGSTVAGAAAGQLHSALIANDRG